MGRTCMQARNAQSGQDGPAGCLAGRRTRLAGADAGAARFRALGAALAGLPPPAGWAAAHLATAARIGHYTALGEQEAEALAALHRAAFGTDHMTVEERLAIMRAPGYLPELDLLAATPGRRVGGLW